MRGLPQHSACCYGIDPGMSLHAFDFRKSRIEDLLCGGSLLVTWYVNLLLSMSLPANSEFRSVYARSASASGMLLWHRPWYVAVCLSFSNGSYRGALVRRQCIGDVVCQLTTEYEPACQE